MKLIDVFDPKLFKSKPLADVVLALIKMQDIFEKSNQGNVLAGHLIGLAQAFRDDNDAILSILDRYQETNRVKSNKQTNPVQKVKFVQPSDISDGFDDGECLDCKKSQVEDKLVEATTNQEDDEFDLSRLKGVKSFRDILNAFMNDGEQMREFLKMRGVSVGNLKDPIKLSKKVYDNLQDDPI